MITGTSKSGLAAAAVNERAQAVNSPINTSSDSGGLLSEQKDFKEAATAPKFGDIYKQIQAKYGEKPTKPREVKKTLGKDDFLRIMLTQMKNQDPTNPFKAEQMATEIAQFTSVEQLQNVNQNLNKMATQNKPLEQMSMTHLIGKMVTIDRERFPHLEGQMDDLNFNLSRNAGSVQVSVESESGEEVFQKDLGPQKAGEVSFEWDGIKSNTLPAKGGGYRIRVNAKDEHGKVIEINPQIQAKVIGVSFEGSEPVFLVGDSRHQDRVTMRNIARIELERSGPEVSKPSDQATLTSKVARTPIAPVSPSNLISFQKGVGSSTQPNESIIIPQKIEEVEKGFMNGLRDSDDHKTELEKGGINK